MTYALCLTTGCPQILDDDFGLFSAVSPSAGASGYVDGPLPDFDGQDAGDAGGAGGAGGGATLDASVEAGPPPILSPQDPADAAAEGGAPAPAPACGQGSLGPDGETCYYLSAATASWSDARQACLDAGQLLVQLDTAEEDTFVANLSPSSLWIGASDTAVDGTFVWSDGSPIVFSHWAPAQPDAYAGPDCVEKRQDTDEPWYDQPCENLEFYVCESPAG